MKRYDKYKPSKIPWIGNIPCHWYVKKLRFISDVQFSNVDKKIVEGEQEIKLCNYLDVYNNDFIGKDIDFMISTASLAEIEKFRLKAGDVLATKDSEDPNDIGVPALVKDDFEDVICGYHLAQIRPSKTALLGMYLFRLLQSDIIRQHFATQANGITRFGLSVSSFKDLQVLLPSLPEQTVIARYLDKKTAQIDDLITKKQRLIELLKEERAAIINQVVTKGINPHVKMKDSRIEWLGKIPEHWEVKRLKYIADINSESLPENTNSDYELEYIDIGNVTLGSIINKPERMLFKNAPSRARRISRKGDTIVSTVRTYLKAITYIDIDKSNLVVSTGFTVVRPRDTLEKKFISYLLTSEVLVETVCSLSVGVSYPAVNASDIGNLLVWYPKDKNEQSIIVKYIEQEAFRINQTITKIQQEIKLLQEYRTALISEVVTGKIDVRDEVVA
ncbi:MAG: restriction endonuclease subunit S [Candidatus Jettenia sp.]|uniref:Putative restriction endonuclease n=1 Tax=Candidatus Jettenia caeni TaxID=247490 RepID=I3IRI0_9BACT|nr:restriction endonuclease subunit S [Candidatus Jettenia sp. AMX1]MBC6928380.1 restriction endonuclease subunit S [Candidatus Jettenia sp.]GAB64325.1 putative restriction endonuclease [Candidatus Jettenia caeni]KAA0250501.1 MAG: restriction endonuclease subunit S [Candidatus Jettenia sp. AMX1]MCE7879690.1 restriction endonuclease subunit S [Candidatus Jettenia sp. AMX1]MCQ3926558.1 restriction endonuclease subunit S [Candidatus Jettenia sp.]